MNKQNGRRGNCAKYIQYSLSSRYRRKVVPFTLYWNIVHWQELMPLPTRSAVCILHKIFLLGSLCYLFKCIAVVLKYKNREIEWQFFHNLCLSKDTTSVKSLRERGQFEG